MTATSTSRMVVPFMAFVAAFGLALVFAIQHVRREPPVEAKAVVAAFAAQPGAGAVGIDGKMYDRPHLARAQRLLASLK